MSRAFRLGVFVVTTLLILAVGVFMIGSKEFLFSPTYLLRADFQNVAGLINGADVRMGGIHVGTVKEIDLPTGTGGKVTVVMKMSRPTRDIVRKDSVASIETEGLLGSKYIEIAFGTDKAAVVNDGDAIRSEAPVELADVTRDAAAQAKASAASFQDNMEALKHNFLFRGFFRNRGYDNAAELTKNTIARVPAARPTRTFAYDSLFEDPDSAKLRNEKALNEAGKYLETNKFGLVVIASNIVTGDTQEGRVLTAARSKVVRDYLTEKFRFDDTRVKIIGLGKSSKADASKVQILVYPVTVPVASTAVAAANSPSGTSP